MIQVFCGKRGSGKTKSLIDLANRKVSDCKGDIIYVDDDRRPMLELDRRIRFISTEEFKLNDFNSFYGFLCGMLAGDYDIETIFIDGLFNIVSGEICNAAHLFLQLEKLSNEFGIQFYININHENMELPEYIKKYVA